METTKRKRTCEGTGHLIADQNACEGILAQRTLGSDLICEFGIDYSSKLKSGECSPSELKLGVATALSDCVVSLASFVGDTMLCRCTGISFRSSCDNTASILTSASLVRSSDDENKIIDNLSIKVRLPTGQFMFGWLHHYDLAYDLAVVNIRSLYMSRTSVFSYRRGAQFETNSELVSVGRYFDSGMLATTRGTVIGRLNDECEFMLSTCKINKDWIGGPLVNFNGSFAGINCCDGERATFLPKNKILERLGHFGILRDDINQEGDGTRESSTRKIRKYTNEDDMLLDEYREYARCNGYPLPDMVSEDIIAMRVINSFEDEFDSDIWSTLDEDIHSTISDCVVSLASFNESARLFACTGIFINCYPARILTSASLIRKSDNENKIDDNLRIEVCFQNKHVVGTLKYYNLCYNVAIVDILGFRSPRAIELEKLIHFTPNADVVAIGYRFKYLKLMATKGVLSDKACKLDCRALRLSTCKITKAGIGGPLIDTCGNFVGMNFYGDKETPYLPRESIQGLLRDFDAKRHTAAETTDEGASNRWPLPKPYWHYPYPVFSEIFEARLDVCGQL